MSKSKDGDKVKVHYSAKLKDGTVFDSSFGRDPLDVVIGEGLVLPEFEKALLGMEPGQKKTFTVKSKDAYGDHRKDLVIDVERSQIPEDLELQVGQQLQVSKGEGTTAMVTVVDISEELVVLDANHPLAGKDLVFEIELHSIESDKK